MCWKQRIICETEVTIWWILNCYYSRPTSTQTINLGRCHIIRWVLHKVTIFQDPRKVKGKIIGVHKHIIPSYCYNHDQGSMPNSWMSFVVQNIPHTIVSEGRTHKRSVGINKPRSAILVVIYNLMYPKIIYLKEIDIFNMTYFKRGIVVFDIHLSEFVSYIHNWYHTNQYKTEFHQID